MNKQKREYLTYEKLNKSSVAITKITLAGIIV